MQPTFRLNLAETVRPLDSWDRWTVFVGGLVLGISIGFSFALIVVSRDDATAVWVVACSAGMVILSTALNILYFVKTQSVLTSTLATIRVALTGDEAMHA